MSDPLTVLAVAAGGAASAVVDVASRRVPNALTFSIASAGLAIAALRLSGIGPAAALCGCVLGFVLMLPAYTVGATGGGDVKLFAAFGALVGPERIGVAFIYTALAGGALAAAAAWRRRRLTGTIAYAPAIALGTLAAAMGW